MTFEEFQRSRTIMRATQFGAQIGDAQWEDEKDTFFLVYMDAYYIEILKENRHCLVIGNQSWISGLNSTLDTMERELHAFALTN